MVCIRQTYRKGKIAPYRRQHTKMAIAIASRQTVTVYTQVKGQLMP